MKIVWHIMMNARDSQYFFEFISETNPDFRAGDAVVLVFCSSLGERLRPTNATLSTVEYFKSQFDYAQKSGLTPVLPLLREHRGHTHFIQPFPTDHAASIIDVPRSKDLARMLIAQSWQALRPGGKLFLRVANELGSKGWATQFRKRLGDAFSSSSRSHARYMVLTKEAGSTPFEDWEILSVVRNVGTTFAKSWLSLPGDFSYKGLDKGSLFLIDTLLENEAVHHVLQGDGLDLCSGNGFLSISLCQELAQVRSMYGVEHFYPSILIAEELKIGVGRPTSGVIDCEFEWTDARSVQLSRTFDFIVANPPHHFGTKTDAKFGAEIIKHALNFLKPGGKVLFVANSQLPYERLLPEKPETIVRSSAFKVLSYTKPSDVVVAA